jgi:hypothetical protein
MNLVVSGRTPTDILALVTDPTIEQVEDAVTGLDNEAQTAVTLSVGPGILFIGGGHKDRVIVKYREDNGVDSKSGILTDPEYSEEDGGVEINVNGEIDDLPLHDTVSKDLALEVARYAVKHSILPKGLNWEGNMDRYA